MIDKSINFGQQNFLFVEVSEVDETYDYVGYQTKKGAVLIARFLKDGSSAKYWLGSGDFEDIFADRESSGYAYVYPSELIDPPVV